MRMNIFFVFNPKAGKGKIKSKLGDIIELFSMADNTITIAATRKRGDAARLVRDLEDGYDRVICAGGDGTLDEVVSGMAQREKDRRVPIGYIPGGSTNDFAFSAGIPSDIMKAAKTAIGERLMPCDVGVFNNKTFVYIAAFGAFTEVSYQTPQDLKNVFGHSAYILEAITRLGDIKPYHMHIETDDLTIDDDFLYGMITNSESAGGIKNITGKNVDLKDGLFEVTLVRKPANPLEINVVLAALVNRDITCKDLYCFKTSHITFTSEHKVPWTLDGEFGGNVKIAEITNMKHGMKLAVEKKSSK
ncbi:MAG: diacylglycerol kinase family lipid kinase [Lachnospiraceae bacterium]|nr:diacylglycerol kinase family lipid kinase [Lachnospiraceae bacterium]